MLSGGGVELKPRSRRRWKYFCLRIVERAKAPSVTCVYSWLDSVDGCAALAAACRSAVRDQYIIICYVSFAWQATALLVVQE